MGKSSYNWGRNVRNIILASGCMILASATVRDIVGRLNIKGQVFIPLGPQY